MVMKVLVTNWHYFDNCMESNMYGKYNQLQFHCSHVGQTVILYKMAQTIDYQGCQHQKKKNCRISRTKEYRFFVEVAVRVGIFSYFEE
jgi:hypothetical protein